jgi:hypothetical protein
MTGKQILERLRADKNLGGQLSVSDLGDEWADFFVKDLSYEDHRIPADAVRTILAEIPALTRHKEIPFHFTTPRASFPWNAEAAEQAWTRLRFYLPEAKLTKLRVVAGGFSERGEDPRDNAYTSVTAQVVQSPFKVDLFLCNGRYEEYEAALAWAKPFAKQQGATLETDHMRFD